MQTKATLVILAALIVIVAVSCDKLVDPGNTADIGSDIVDVSSSLWPTAAYPAPSGIVSVEFLGQTLTFWPFTGADFSGNPQDPVNLIFFGNADPRDIRAALLSLDGDRTAFGYGNVPPFNARWEDAIGDVQPGYGEPGGWTPGVVQLACGEYGPIRFHPRLFKIGDWTVGNAHFEMLIPGTSDHQVLNWNAAEDLVTVDMLRSGLLDESVPMGTSQYINQEPFKTIPAILYNELPVDLRYYIGGPIEDVTEDVPMPTDGIIPIFNLARSVPRVAEVRTQSLVIEFGQYIPKPFCASSPYDYVYVQGPVNLTQTTELREDGQYIMTFRAEGELGITPIDISTGQPVGETLTAIVKEHHDANMNDDVAAAWALLSQKIVPASDPNAGSFYKRLRVSSAGAEGFQVMVKCPGEEEFHDVTGDPDAATSVTEAVKR